MKTINYLFLSLCLLCTQLAIAQKNSPVTGDAAQLVDLLKKDYGAIDPSTRNDEVIKDRALVIAIFKTYLTAQQDSSLRKKTSDAYITTLNKYKKAQQTFSLFTATPPASASNFGQYAKTIDSLNDSVETTRKAYYQKRFIVDSLDLTNLGEVYKNDNEYIKYMISLFKDKYKAIDVGTTDAFSKSNPASSVQKSIPFIGGDMGFEMVIEGLSKFLAKRIKEELTTYVIDRVRDWLQNPKQDYALAELKVLLPRTYAYLITFDASQITSFPNEIKQYIEDDFNHMLENMAGLRNTSHIKILIAKYPEIDFAMEALELIPSLTKIKNPVDYFELLENSRNIQRWAESDNVTKYNIANTIKLSAMLAHSFTIVENGQVRLASTDFISTYSADANFYFLYTGFLNQQNLKYYDIQFKIKTNIKIVKNNEVITAGTISEKDIFKYPLRYGLHELVKNDPSILSGNFESLKKDRVFFQTLLMQISENAEKVYVSAQEIKKANKTGATIGADTAYAFIKSVIDLAEEVTFSGDTLINYFLCKIDLVNKKISEIKIDYSDKYLKFEIDTRAGSDNITKIQLKEQAAPYFKIAHTTNEVLLDLHKKRYATALIKALEVMNDLAPKHTIESFQYLQEAIELSTQLSGIAKDWSNVIGVIQAGKNFKPRSEAASRFVFDELTKINTYYKSNYEISGSSIGADITILIAYTKAMSEKVKVRYRGTDSLRLDNLLKDPSFKAIVLSYYLNQRTDVLADRLEKELIDFRIQTKNGEDSLFSRAEATALKTSFNNYLIAVFQYLITNKENNFNDANKEFAITVTEYFYRVPEKFDFHINEQVLKLIHFVNDMALAQNSDDIEKAIEAFALPAGSYSIKRESRFNVSINSFPGILPAAELTWKGNTCYGNYSMGFTAPVGFSFALGTPKGFSHGIFVPILDIGAVTRMQLTNNGDTDSLKATTLPEFNFMSVFSPGVYYSLGLPKTPISFNFGAQYGPGLRQIEANGETTVYESIRLGAAIVIDIPLLNLHTRPRFKK